MYSQEATLTITNCEFTSNHATDDEGGAIHCVQSSNVTVANSTFFENTASLQGGALSSDGSSAPAISNSIFWGNTPDQIRDNGQTVSYSIVEGGFAGTGNLDEDPLFTFLGDEAFDPDLTLRAGSPAIDAANNNLVPMGVTADLDGNPRFVDDPSVADTGVGTPPIVDMGAYERQMPATFLVDMGGGGDFTTIQAAIDAAEDGDIININTGSYLLGAPLDLGTKNLTIQANPSVGAGTAAIVSINGNDTHQLMLINGGQTAATQIRGLIFENGLALDGGAVMVTAASPVFEDCLFNSNSAESFGGAVAVDEGSPVFNACTFTGNSADSGGAVYSFLGETAFNACEFSNGNNARLGGAFLSEGDSGTCSDSLFVGNTAEFGGAVNALSLSTYSFVDCVFDGNTASMAGGAYSNFAAADSFERCMFLDNQATTTNGGAMNIGGNGGQQIVNCLFSGNVAAGSGGALASFETTVPVLINCTLADNSANGSGGAVFGGGSSTPVLQNCVVSGNAGTQIDGAGAAVNYSLVEGGFAGMGNVDGELGWLRAAPAFGAVIVAAFFAARPLTRHVGTWMLIAIAIYGVALLGFAVSTVFWLSMAALAITGAADMVSVFVRQSLIQLATPDAMRGRVSSVSFIFISGSNELGEFESGVAARFLGPVGAVLLGGAVAIAAALSWRSLFPEMARADRFEDAAVADPTAPQGAG